MLKFPTVFLSSGFLLLGWWPLASAAGEEPLADQVRESIKRGVQFLREQEGGRGHWEKSAFSVSYPGGTTSLALLALLSCGLSPDDPDDPDGPMMRRGLDYLRGKQPTMTYTVGLQTMVFALARQEQDLAAIRRNVNWLVEKELSRQGPFRGWGYTNESLPPDNSNTQYALLGLHEAQRARVAIKPEVWKSIQDYYIQTQQFLWGEEHPGGWGYRPGGSPSLTMTTAGLCGLLIAGMKTNVSNEISLPNDHVQNCGQYDKKSNRAVTKAIDWIGQHFPPTAGDFADVAKWPHSSLSIPGPNVYYSLYGIERAGRLTGQRFFGGHDWYRVGSEFLVSKQGSDGSWRRRRPWRQ